MKLRADLPKDSEQIPGVLSSLTTETPVSDSVEK